MVNQTEIGYRDPGKVELVIRDSEFKISLNDGHFIIRIMGRGEWLVAHTLTEALEKIGDHLKTVYPIKAEKKSP